MIAFCCKIRIRNWQIADAYTHLSCGLSFIVIFITFLWPSSLLQSIFPLFSFFFAFLIFLTFLYVPENALMLYVCVTVSLFSKAYFTSKSVGWIDIEQISNCENQINRVERAYSLINMLTALESQLYPVNNSIQKFKWWTCMESSYYCISHYMLHSSFYLCKSHPFLL
jgi:hypothetical protein